MQICKSCSALVVWNSSHGFLPSDLFEAITSQYKIHETLEEKKRYHLYHLVLAVTFLILEGLKQLALPLRYLHSLSDSLYG